MTTRKADIRDTLAICRSTGDIYDSDDVLAEESGGYTIPAGKPAEAIRRSARRCYQPSI